MAFYSGNVELAKKRLNQAQIKANEKEDAQKLRSLIAQAEVSAVFEELNFEGVIELINKIKNNTQFPVDANLKNRLDVVSGIAHLYLGKHVEASALLSSAPDFEETKKFAFYLLINDLYLNDFSSFNLFVEKHQNLFKDLEQDRKEYLEIAFSIRKGNFQEAAAKLKSYKQVSRSHFININAQKNILLQNEKEKLNPEKLKPLYKLLLEEPLLPNEYVFLEHFSDLKELLIENKKSIASSKTYKKTERFYENENPLPYKQFQSLLKTSRPEDLPRLVYNQVVLLYNNGAVEAAYKTAIQHKIPFFKIPESISLLLSATYRYDDVNILEAIRTVLGELQKRHQQYTQAQLDSISWLIYKQLYRTDPEDNPLLDKEIRALLKESPALIGLYMWQLFRSTHGDKKRTFFSRKSKKSTIPIFDFPNLKENKAIFINELDDMLDGIYETITQNLFTRFFDLDDEESQKAFVDVFISLIKTINSSSTSNNFSVKSKEVVLETYKLLNKYLIKVYDLLPQNYLRNIERQLKPTYKKLLEQFNEYDPSSSYYKSYHATDWLPKIVELKDCFDHEDFEQYATLLIELVDLEQMELLSNTLVNYIIKSNYSETEAVWIGYTISILNKEYPEQASDLWLQLLYKLKEKSNPNSYYAASFHGHALEAISKFKGRNLSENLYQYIELFGRKMMENIQAKIYNNIAKFLEGLLKEKKSNATFIYDQSLIDELIDYIGVVAKTRGLKGLTKKYNKIKPALRS